MKKEFDSEGLMGYAKQEPTETGATGYTAENTSYQTSRSGLD